MSENCRGAIDNLSIDDKIHNESRRIKQREGALVSCTVALDVTIHCSRCRVLPLIGFNAQHRYCTLVTHLS